MYMPTLSDCQDFALVLLYRIVERRSSDLISLMRSRDEEGASYTCLNDEESMDLSDESSGEEEDEYSDSDSDEFSEEDD